MRAAAAKAGMLSAVVLLSPGCGDDSVQRVSESNEPLRRASFRSLAALDFLASCPGGAGRAETTRQVERFEELKAFARRKDAGHSIWLGENDWAAVAQRSQREPCPAGEEAFGEALAAFGGSLDELATRIAEHPAERRK